MRKGSHMRLPLLAVALALALSAAAAAQDEPWPTHPVRLIAASGPGGNPDVLARLLAEKFTTAFGKPFVVENVPGAGGIVAANMVAKAPPDGHVLMFGDSGAMAINPALNANLGYDPIKDFARSPRSSACRPSCRPIQRHPTRSRNSSRSPKRRPAR